jgi:hypothetical protein
MTEYHELCEWVRDYHDHVHKKTDFANNKTRKERELTPIGSLVLCQDFKATRSNRRLNKLSSVWTGPWTIISTWKNSGVTIKRVGGDQVKRVHKDHVKLFTFCKTTPKELRQGREPKKPTATEQGRVLRKLLRSQTQAMSEVSSEPESGSDGEEFELEEIVGHFHNVNGFWFLIRYTGYSGLFWEHESVVNAPKLISSYFRKICQEEK